MLRQPVTPPRRVLITLDAVGGVWRYALDVARGLKAYDVSCLLVGFGPEPDDAQREESSDLKMVWTTEPLDWTVADDTALNPGTAKISEIANDWNADLLHLNLPSQAAGLPEGLPVIVASHSCVPTWWDAVRGTDLPSSWRWQQQRNELGFQRADAILVPSQSHGAALRRVYTDLLAPLHVVYNATSVAPVDLSETMPLKQATILAVGRWWDPGKNGETLDAAAATVPWPIVLAGPLHGPNGDTASFHNVCTPGPLSHAEILAQMRRAAIFAAPSRFEPFGLAVAEAALCGAALVLADIPTFRELWHDAALFVPVNEANAWSQALTRLAADTALRTQLAEKAQSRSYQFTLPKQAGRLCELYESVASTVHAA